MAGAPSYRHGRIVWADLRARLSGKRERHPAVILDKDEDIVQPQKFDPRKHANDNLIHVIGVSTKYMRPSPPAVRLPWSPSGHAITKLREDCAAIIGWYHRLVIPDDVIGFGGDVPATLMAQIDQGVRNDLTVKLKRHAMLLRDMFTELFGNEV